MTLCPLTYDATSNRWTCPDCGWSYSPRDPSKVDPSKPPHRNCPKGDAPEVIAQRCAEWAEATARYSEVVEPTLAEKLVHYASALRQWRAAGYPVRTDEQVAAIIETCHDCEKWNAAEQACNVCGCGVNASKWAVVNKARMATEVCPEGKWPEAAGRAATAGGTMAAEG